MRKLSVFVSVTLGLTGLTGCGSTLTSFTPASSTQTAQQFINEQNGGGGGGVEDSPFGDACGGGDVMERRGEDDTFEVKKPKSKSSFTLDSVKSLLGSGKAKTLDDIIQSMPASYLQNFALVYESKSDKNANSLAPRVLNFGEDATFITAYGSGKGAKDELHMIAFEPTDSSFHFYRIRDEKNGQLKLETDPADCKSCHAGASRPTWNTYSVWPGVYFGLHDNLAKGSVEQKNYQAFLDASKSNTRYAKLPLATGKEDHFGPLATLNAGNDALTRSSLALSKLNWERIYQKLTKSPAYEDNKIQVARALLNCPATKSSSVGKSLADYEAEVQSNQLKYRTQLLESSTVKEAGLKAKDLDAIIFPATAATAKTKFIVEQKLGLSTAGWSMTTLEESDSYSTPAAGLLDLAVILTERDLDLKILGDLSEKGAIEQACNDLLIP